ncbi:hypothetical protein M758_7G071300, partial [Ceratodon purpureus]
RPSHSITTVSHDYHTSIGGVSSRLDAQISIDRTARDSMVVLFARLAAPPTPFNRSPLRNLDRSPREDIATRSASLSPLQRYKSHLIPFRVASLVSIPPRPFLSTLCSAWWLHIFLRLCLDRFIASAMFDERFCALGFLEQSLLRMGEGGRECRGR